MRKYDLATDPTLTFHPLELDCTFLKEASHYDYRLSSALGSDPVSWFQLGES